jgi:hypothetical protein
MEPERWMLSYRNTPLNPILSQLNPVLILTTYLSNIYITILFLLHLDLLSDLFPLGFPTEMCAGYLFRQANHSRISHQKIVR